ncbi:unnamed protein product [Penicillium camemberti]|uniref:Str. FM013 n=1 Tax=Penicillium camemberti (strain FM 013) TaxID=1429867 RepID=A0A0G4P4K5_PENC3|nr:unnamed protein product [Penicillium camemberti]
METGTQKHRLGIGQYHVLMFVQQEALIQSLRFVVISG